MPSIAPRLFNRNGFLCRKCQESGDKGLSERGDRLADRLETLVRAARPVTLERPVVQQEGSRPKAVSQIERDLLQTLRMAR
jgi:hypothetical protein